MSETYNLSSNTYLMHMVRNLSLLATPTKGSLGKSRQACTPVTTPVHATVLCIASVATETRVEQVAMLVVCHDEVDRNSRQGLG